MNEDDRKTPVDTNSTIQAFAHDMHATKLAAQNAETVQLAMYEDFKKFRTEVDGWRARVWTPTVLAFVAAVISFACAAAACVGR